MQAASSDPGSEPVNLINGSGLRDVDFDDLNEHRANPSYMWRSAKGEAQNWVEFDFGTPQKLNAICVWNYNDTWHTNQGVRKMSVSAWTSGTGWQKILAEQQIDQAEGGDGYDEPTIIKLDATTVQKVRFDALTNLGDPDYVGLSEVQFFGPLGPQAVRAYPPDGAAGVNFNDLELAWVTGEGVKAQSVYLGTSVEALQPLGKTEKPPVKISHLKSNTKYFWRVEGTQADGSVTSSKVWSFTTGGGLAGWWKLDESEGTVAADSSGNRHDGTLCGNPVWQPKGGKIGGALQFDGMQDAVDTGWADDLATWTVAVWVKSPAAPVGAQAPSGPVHRQANYQINWNHHTSEHRGDVGFRDSSNWRHASLGSLSADTWYHLVGTFDGRSLKAYKDGVLVSESSASGRPVHERATLKLGRHATDEGYFAGTIDEVCIFAYALSIDEVKALYSGKEPAAIAAGSDSATPRLVSQR